MIGPDGRMTEEAGERFAGLTAAEAQEAVVAALREEGVLRAEEPYAHSVPFSHRSGERIEPLISLQWFCRMDELAKPAIEVVERDEVRIAPGAVEARLPRLDAGDPPLVRLAPALVGPPDPGLVLRRLRGDVSSPRQPPERCGACGGELRQEEDVLDTWFSSALWPFATLGWPDDTPELRAFYPTSFLTTAREILFLWVARMVMTGHRVRRRRPLPRRLRALGDPGPRRAADVEEPRHRDRPAGGDRRARRRRAALRPAGDVLDPGRALLRRQGPAGPRPRQQALERLPADPAQRRRGRAGAAAAAASRTAGSSRGWSATIASVTEKLEAYDFAHAAQEAYSFFWSRALRLVPGDRQAAPLRRRGGGLGDAALRAGAGAGAAAPDDAVRHRGDLVLPPGPRSGHLVVHPFPEADESLLDADGRGRGRGRDRADPAPARLARPGRGAGGERAAGARRRGRAAGVRRPPRPLRVRRRRRRAGRRGRPGRGPRLRPRSTPRRSPRGSRSGARSCAPRSSAARASSATRASSPRRRPRWSRRSAASSSATGPSSRSSRE